VDKLTLAALEATLLGPTPPVLSTLDVGVEELATRADRILRTLMYAGVEAAIVPSRATIGGGGAPGVELLSVALSLPERYTFTLRMGQPAIVGRVEHGRCLLDLRTIAPDQDDEVISAVIACT
jgi:L-seryl-tRNA(Ser) seleniumtransferase